MKDADIGFMSAAALAAAYSSREISPVEATRAILERIEALNDALNAFCLVDADGALKAARESEKRWAAGEPLSAIDGVPTSVKDLILAKGWPTGRGSLVAASGPAEADAPSVARLREAGCVLIGKTTTPEMGWKGVTDCPRTGITRNPWDPSKTPGGSSGGAAAQVAAGLGQLAIGTDGGGSIRIPAGFSGIAGIKPAFGRVPAWPMSPFGTVAHVGPMARTIEDCALMLTVMAKGDARDWYALPDSGTDFAKEIEDGVKGMRIAVSRDLGVADLDPEIAALFDAAVEVLAGLGADVEEADPGIGDCFDIFQTHWTAGAAKVLSAFDAGQRAQMDPGLVAMAEEGARLSLMDYLNAAAERAELGARMRAFHTRFDALVTPTLPIPAFEAGELSPRGWPERRGRNWIPWTPFSYPFNLTQQPAASVPCGFTRAGLPGGLHIVGPMHDEATMLRIARAYETATDWGDRRPAMADIG